MSRHRHQEFLRFLRAIDRNTLKLFDLHLVVDNYAIHKHAKVKTWLKRHPRFHPNIGLLDQSGRPLLRLDHQRRHPPRRLPQRLRTQDYKPTWSNTMQSPSHSSGPGPPPIFSRKSPEGDER
jgi:hypothetical protein